MKIPKFIPEKKLKATTRRVSQRAAVDDYDQEPNMKLSSAFVVVLVLHIVAVGGMFAFDSIKANRQNQTLPTEQVQSMVVQQQDNVEENIVSDDTVATQKIPVSEKRTNALAGSKENFLESVATAKPHAQPAFKPTEVKGTNSAKIYVVEKGDNPVAIARKLEVNYEDLLKLNNINDPRLLQIGQKLKIPPKK